MGQEGRPPEQSALAPARSGAPAELSRSVSTRFGPQKSAFHLLTKNEEALMWRLALIDTATSSIDIQYYLWNNDEAGRLLFMRLVDAAERGVRVRLLVDDFLFAGGEETFAALSYHPNLEIKLFNPKVVRKGRSGQLVEWALNFDELNRRMHNKAFVVDNRVAIMGGRNIGNAYFGLSKKYNFIDLDVLTSGRVVEDISDGFDLFWNSKAAIPGRLMSRRSGPEDTAGTIAKLRTLVARKQGLLLKTPFPIERQNWSQRFRDVASQWHSGTALMLQDQPLTNAKGRRASFITYAPTITDFENPTELLAVSPYLLPGEVVYKSLARNTSGGADVRLLTASLGSTNQPLVHSHYRKHRRKILSHGARLHEFRPDPSPRMRAFADTAPVRSQFVSIHAKTMVGDRRNCFIGSLNLDPRSIDHNSENGLLIDSPSLAKELAEFIELIMASENSWEVTTIGPAGQGRLRWQSQGTTRTTQPAPNFGKRVSDFFYGFLPIEDQL